MLNIKYYDIIGDIHGEADKLIQLLEKLGYKAINGVYQQLEHQVIFVGDFIDRGSKQKAVLEIVKAMIDSKHALSVMGNHELNAICYHTRDVEGNYLRLHTENRQRQHQAFLQEFPLGDSETQKMINWFKTLPLFLELGGFRVIHACWQQSVIDKIKPLLDENNCLKPEHYPQTIDKNHFLYEATEVLLKGKELTLPNNQYFTDKDGIPRHNIRVKWWKQELTNYREMAVVSESNRHLLPNLKIPKTTSFESYPANAPTVFFGHYWFTGTPQPVTNNTVCLDYSAVRSGKLVAYRLNPKQVLPLKAENFKTSL